MRHPIRVTRPHTARGEMFLDRLRGRIPGQWDQPVPADPKYAGLVSDIDAMSSPSKLALLETASSTLHDGEVYLEVGALFGASTVAAGLAGPDVRMIVVDNFSQFGGSAERLMGNLRKYRLEERVELVVDDYRNALRRSFPPVGVYFFDGPHGYLDQYIAFELGLPHLADEALVIIDDTRWPHVRRANLDYVASHPAFTLLCDLPSPKLNDRGWWNGLQVFEYRSRAEDGGRDIRFHVNRARYAVLQPMKLYEIYYPHIMPVVDRLKRRGRALASLAVNIARGRKT